MQTGCIERKSRPRLTLPHVRQARVYFTGCFRPFALAFRRMEKMGRKCRNLHSFLHIRTFKDENINNINMIWPDSKDLKSFGHLAVRVRPPPSAPSPPQLRPFARRESACAPRLGDACIDCVLHVKVAASRNFQGRPARPGRLLGPARRCGGSSNRFRARASRAGEIERLGARACPPRPRARRKRDGAARGLGAPRRAESQFAGQAALALAGVCDLDPASETSALRAAV